MSFRFSPLNKLALNDDDILNRDVKRGVLLYNDADKNANSLSFGNHYVAKLTVQAEKSMKLDSMFHFSWINRSGDDGSIAILKDVNGKALLLRLSVALERMKCFQGRVQFTGLPMLNWQADDAKLLALKWQATNPLVNGFKRFPNKFMRLRLVTSDPPTAEDCSIVKEVLLEDLMLRPLFISRQAELIEPPERSGLCIGVQFNPSVNSTSTLGSYIVWTGIQQLSWDARFQMYILVYLCDRAIRIFAQGSSRSCVEGFCPSRGNFTQRQIESKLGYIAHPISSWMIPSFQLNTFNGWIQPSNVINIEEALRQPLIVPSIQDEGFIVCSPESSRKQKLVASRKRGRGRDDLTPDSSSFNAMDIVDDDEDEEGNGSADDQGSNKKQRTENDDTSSSSYSSSSSSSTATSTSSSSSSSSASPIVTPGNVLSTNDEIPREVNGATANLGIGGVSQQNNGKLLFYNSKPLLFFFCFFFVFWYIAHTFLFLFHFLLISFSFSFNFFFCNIENKK